MMQKVQQWFLSVSHRQAKPFFLALLLLTRLPVPDIDYIQTEDHGRSAIFYPLIGLLIGIMLVVPMLFFSHAPALLMASIIITLWVIITGALHLDGLADSADGWLGGMGNAEKIQTIMKDSRVGTAGVVAITCLLALKLTAITTLVDHGSLWTIILAPMMARAMILVLFTSTPYVNQKGMAQAIIETVPRQIALLVMVFCGFIGILVSFWGLLFVVLGFWLLRRLMLEQLGGCTGDTTGATVEISEMLWLIGSALNLT